jgi:hypothetical protein
LWRIQNFNNRHEGFYKPKIENTAIKRVKGIKAFYKAKIKDLMKCLDQLLFVDWDSNREKMVLPHLTSASAILPYKDEHGDAPLFVEGSDLVDDLLHYSSTKVTN